MSALRQSGDLAAQTKGDLFHIFLDRPIDCLQSVEGTLLDARLVAGAQGLVVILCGSVDVAQQPPGLGTHNP